MKENNFEFIPGLQSCRYKSLIRTASREDCLKESNLTHPISQIPVTQKVLSSVDDRLKELFRKEIRTRILLQGQKVRLSNPPDQFYLLTGNVTLWGIQDKLCKGERRSYNFEQSRNKVLTHFGYDSSTFSASKQAYDTKHSRGKSADHTLVQIEMFKGQFDITKYIDSSFDPDSLEHSHLELRAEEDSLLLSVKSYLFYRFFSSQYNDISKILNILDAEPITADLKIQEKLALCTILQENKVECRKTVKFSAESNPVVYLVRGSVEVRNIGPISVKHPFVPYCVTSSGFIIYSDSKQPKSYELTVKSDDAHWIVFNSSDLEHFGICDKIRSYLSNLEKARNQIVAGPGLRQIIRKAAQKKIEEKENQAPLQKLCKKSIDLEIKLPAESEVLPTLA